MKDNRLYVGKEMYLGIQIIASNGKKVSTVSEPCPIIELAEDKMVIHVKGEVLEDFITFDLSTFNGECYIKRERFACDVLQVASDDLEEVEATISA